MPPTIVPPIVNPQLQALKKLPDAAIAGREFGGDLQVLGVIQCADAEMNWLVRRLLNCVRGGIEPLFNGVADTHKCVSEQNFIGSEGSIVDLVVGLGGGKDAIDFGNWLPQA